MNKKWLPAFLFSSGPLVANAQLISTDNGLTATDRNGLMWANTVGIDLLWSSTAALGSAQAWVRSLNASSYGGHNDWTLATADGSVGANTTTNQLGQLFYLDCGNSPGGVISLNNAAKDCSALTQLNSVLSNGDGVFPPGYVLFTSGSQIGYDFYGPTFWVFESEPTGSGYSSWDLDVTFWGVFGGDALAVRRVPLADSFATLYNFCSQSGCTDGAGALTELVQATDGYLYGTTFAGGTHNYGTAFKVNTTGKLTTIHSFCSVGGSACADGVTPNAGLIQGANGSFHGTTEAGGGPNDGGTVFKIALNGALTTEYAFGDGANPSEKLLAATDGKYYGTTQDSIFKMTAAGLLTTLHTFNSVQTVGPAGPVSALIQGTDGNFYGTTETGYGGHEGTAFRITSNGTLTLLYTFCSAANCADGTTPTGGLIQGSDGNFYGTTQDVGLNSAPNNNDGTVYRITPAGALTTLYSFCSVGGNLCSDGRRPHGLIQATDGNFYGTTEAGGGLNDGGTIFTISPTGTLTTLYTFCSRTSCRDGSDPSGRLVQNTDGNFYGTTAYGGAHGDGTVFKLSVGLAPFIATQTTSGKQGATVKILGTNLIGATKVTFNGVPATFTVVSKSEIKTTVPAGATTGTVQVKTPTAILNSNVPFRVQP